MQSKERPKSLLGNILLFTLSTIISLLVAEFVLREFTLFPVHGMNSNKVLDEHLLYRLNPELNGVDSDGFRNTQLLEEADIVTIGDSHTFGSNVHSKKSWPQTLARKTGATVYNMGIGGHGITQYRYMFDLALKKNPKTIIVGLFPQNDFAGSYCATMNLEYWKKNAEKMALENKQCELLEAKKIRAELSSTLYAVLDNSALISATRYFLDMYNYPLDKLFQEENSDSFREGSYTDEDFYELKIDSFGKPFSMLLEKIHKKTKDDIKNKEEVKNGFAIFRYMKDKAAKENVDLLIIIIPTREIVGLELAKKYNIKLPKKVKESVSRVVYTHEIFEEFFDGAGFYYVDPTPYLVKAARKNLSLGINMYPNSHPDESGYAAYARSAKDGLALLEANRE